MYGIVNKPTQALVIQQFGTATWENVQLHRGIKAKLFISNQGYDNQITYTLAQSASAVSESPLSDLMVTLGTCGVLRTGKEVYGILIEAVGNLRKEFLMNLPNFQNRVLLVYPKLTPPQFQISAIEENRPPLHYCSKCTILKDFVRGLIQGMATYTQTPVTIALLNSREQKSDHEIFKNCW